MEFRILLVHVPLILQAAETSRDIESEVKPKESPGNKNCCHGDATDYN